ncbi:peritrophin-1-like [Anneissia japonica]|uniref:peritrophin-1-like n=1 Tax=Anneissia japonica TaxID=1529436 RepID=UPI00142569FA|nr:peritrophin-1-like [Anneissia japonica]
MGVVDWKYAVTLFLAAVIYVVCRANPDYDCTDKTPGVYYANPNDPSYFFICVGGTPIIQQCPANLIYYEDREYCDYTSSSEEDDSTTSIIEVGGSTLSTTDGVVDWSTTIGTIDRFVIKR